ncbi:MAG: DMT family transporter [Thermodesulfobacteriota bacterium]
MRGLVYAVLSACCFGTLAIFGKLGYGLGLATWEIIQYRFLAGALILLGYTAATRPDLLRVGPRTLAKAALLGICVYPVQSLCFMGSLAHVPAATTSLILYIYPLAVTLAAAALGRTRINRVVGVSLFLVLAGSALVFYDAFARDMSARGVLLALGAMLTYSTYLTLVQAFLRGEKARSLTLYVILFAALFFNLAGGPGPLLALDGPRLALAAGMGLVSTVLAVSLLFASVELVGSAMASIFSSFEPVATLILAALVLGEPVALPQLGGMACIVAGIALPNLHLDRRRAAVAG